MTIRNSIITEDLDRILAQPLPWEIFSGKTVLVSGASGFLPGSCCEVLLRLNELGRLAIPVNVVAFSRRLEVLTKRFSAYAGRSDLHFLVGDVTSGLPAWAGAVDFLIHGASPASPVAMAADTLGTFEANVSGTRNLLELAQDRQAGKVLFLSSGAVYGQLPMEILQIRESDFGTLDPLTLRSAYAEGKRAGETLCLLYADRYGLSVTVARISHTYGPGLRSDDGRSFADFITAAVEHRPLILQSDGLDVRHFCYLSDTVAGLFAILMRGESGEAYNVGSETEACSILELARMIVDLFPERGLTLVQRAGNADTRRVSVTSSQRPVPFNTEKLKSLGWRDEVKLFDGLRRAILSFESEAQTRT
jgi:dTDP-glucose 4,6-dehydratase